jgi:hypothetical protein
MNDDFDELDRALFALPLEAAPPGLRESILNATVYARARTVAEPEIRTWELWAVGIALAAAAWLIFSLLAYKGFAASFDADLLASGRALSNPSTLVWIGAGSAIAAWLSFLNATGLRLPLGGVRS